MTAADWDALVARSGVGVVAATDVEATRRVEKAAQRLNGTSTDLDIELGLLIAASTGRLRERLTDTQARGADARATLRSEEKSGAGSPVFGPVAILVTVAAIVVLAAGPIAVFPSVRTLDDYLVFDLSTAAVLSGVVTALGAAWFATTELVRNPWGGTRRGLYGPAFLGVAAAWSATGVVATLYRMSVQGGFGATGVGLALQIVGVALYSVTIVVALRNRGEAAQTAAAARSTAPAMRRARHEASVRKETAWALRKASEGELDRGAAMDGLRSLYESGRLPADRTEAVLRALG